jgi:hypothetical protein
MEQIRESILERQSAEPEKPKSKWKFRIAFVAVIFLVLGVVIGARVYKIWKEVNDADLFAIKMEELKKQQEADTFGGATPYETLEMYIAAVEKGDFELASKYFVIEKQEAELNKLKTSPRENVDNINNLLKQAQKEEGSYSTDKKAFSILRPIFVDFWLYPKGIWKINEI